MTSHKILFTLSVLAALYAVTAQYDTYEHSEEEDDREDEKPKVDYSKYFGGLGAVAAPGNPAQAADNSAGFVQPLDFTGFFAGGHFGLDGLAGGASQPIGIGTPGGASVLPLPSGVFPVVNEPVTANTSGFVSNIKFPSLFDSSGSSSENGFRPRDFIQQGSRPESTSPSTFYSPTFATLQRYVDREVDYQKKEEDGIERSRAASRRVPEYDSVEDDDDEEFDSFEFDDSPDTEYRSNKKHKNPPHMESEERHGVINRKELSYETPYSSVNQVTLQGPSQPRQVNGSPKTPLPSLPEQEDDYAPSVNYQSRQYSGKSHVPSRNSIPNKNRVPYHSTNVPPTQSYNSPQHFKQPTRPRHPAYNNGNPRPIKNNPSYYSAQSNPIPVHQRTSDSNLNRPPKTFFRPSPIDPYSETPQQFSNERELSNNKQKIPDRDGIYSLPQTEYATVIERKTNQPANLESQNKKHCKKINKKIDPDDFARFKRQQMTCYICTNKEKGNTYEECSYESDPKSNAFYKGSAEAYSSDTVLTPTKYHVRKRRSTVPNRNNHLRSRAPTRRVRQRDYDYDPDERGHGPENYRFGPQYFQDDGGRQNVKRKPQKQVERTDYDEDYDDGDETDVEKEYEPPGAGESDDCHKVNRNGLICMVCNKPKSGGTYEQCSYASDPEENRYEYAKSSRYGSKRPQSYRYKRYTINRNDERKNYKRGPENKKYYLQEKKNRNRRGDFRNGKLKRKKVVKADYKRPLLQSANENHNVNASADEDYPTKIVGLDPFFYGSSESYNPNDYDERGRKIKRRDDDDEEAVASSREDDEDDHIPTYEDSFYRLFPELVGTDPYTGESIENRVKEKEARGKLDDIEHPRIPYEEAEDEEESESIQTNSKVKPGFEYGLELPDYYFNDDESKKDLEKTLDEFTHKNRSDCKKVIKDKMTCYQCINSNGLQHEECMFVAASEPKSKHLAYHEVKEFRVIPTEKSSNESTLNDSINVLQNEEDSENNAPNKSTNNGERVVNNNGESHLTIYKIPKKTINKIKEEKSKKIKPMTENLRQINQGNIEGETLPPITQEILKVRPKEMKTNFYNGDPQVNIGVPRQKRNPKKEIVQAESRQSPNAEQSPGRRYPNPKEEDEEEEVRTQTPPVRSNYNAVPPDPEGFDEREGPEGAFSQETEPVFDSVLKITLPRYMITRSEHEDIFDEVLRSG